MIYWRKMPKGLKRKEETICARELLADAISMEYQITTLPFIDTDSYGKPYFPEYPWIQFNYSHSKNMTACVISEKRVGIDLEKVRPFQEKTARKFCNAKEWGWLQERSDKDSAWIHIWNIKEAYVKYTGDGIRKDLKRLDTFHVLEERGKMPVCIEENSDIYVYVQSVYIEDFWLTVCSTKDIGKTIYCI